MLSYTHYDRQQGKKKKESQQHKLVVIRQTSQKTVNEYDYINKNA